MTSRSWTAPLLFHRMAAGAALLSGLAVATTLAGGVIAMGVVGLLAAVALGVTVPRFTSSRR